MVSISVTTAGAAGVVQLPGDDHQVRLGAEQSEDDVGCVYDRQSGFEYSDTGSGQLVHSGGNIPAIGLLHASFNASGQMSAVRSGWRYAPAMIMLTPNQFELLYGDDAWQVATRPGVVPISQGADAQTVLEPARSSDSGSR